ncbi:hypothetical protein [Nitrospira moscoviensis]|uniref:Uncharacterized protein n=1 Tax=Nitrospira moscoviensis TaxID=42253 RepID=A0A0K2GDT4_NITMO|nr:hypothetical protein [Nitrospira moscoviensis]ALA58772.1 hypothetical protein NITMOv2_2357 [Nitrospira moscoviensis]
MPPKRKGATGITNAPLEREQREQERVPPRGESVIGKGRNRKPKSPGTRRKTAGR